MKPVASIFGKTTRRKAVRATTDWPLPHQLIGLEIEAENGDGVVLPHDVGPTWTMHRDGSLRNGQEYTLATPLRGTALAEAIALIFSEGKFTRSVTGSTHIHVDMMEPETTQDVVKALVLMLYALEPALFAIGDRGREFCGYTNKLSSAPDELMASVLNSTDDQPTMLVRFCKDEFRAGRYYGINILALAKYGSVEFRYFPTATSADELTSWVSLTMCFKKAATEVGGVAGVMRVFENPELYDTFLAQYFGPWYDVFRQEVPQHMARSAVHKALAVASSYQASGGDRFDNRAITENKLIAAKFYKKKAAPQPQLNVRVLSPAQPAPSANEAMIGTVLVTTGGIYISDGHNWQSPPYDSPPLLHRARAQQIVDAMTVYGPNLVAAAESAGYAPRTINTVRSRYIECMNWVCRNNGVLAPTIPFSAEQSVPAPHPMWDNSFDTARIPAAMPRVRARNTVGYPSLDDLVPSTSNNDEDSL